MIDTEQHFRVNIKPKLPGDDNIVVTHGQGELVAAYSIYGPNNALGLLNEIETDNKRLAEAGLVRRIRQAMTGETISIVHPAYNLSVSGEDNGKVVQEITDAMNKRCFRAATGILYHPDNKLAYFVPNPKFDSQSIVDISDLIRRVESAPETYRTVPFSEITGWELSPSDLLTNPYVIEWADGKESTEKLKELADRAPARKAHLWVPNVSQMMRPEGRVADLGVYSGGGLDVGGDSSGEGGGLAFGVLLR